MRSITWSGAERRGQLEPVPDAVDGDHLAGAARLGYGHRVETEPPGALDDHVVAESLINPLETVHHLGEGEFAPAARSSDTKSDTV